MRRNDRRAIAALLLPHFPSMEKATSDEWHGFLNAETGLEVGLDEPNAVAFDRWRQKLGEQGLPVWPYSETQIAAITKRGRELKALEDKRRENLAVTLGVLAKEAPNVTADQLAAGRVRNGR